MCTHDDDDECVMCLCNKNHKKGTELADLSKSKANSYPKQQIISYKMYTDIQKKSLSKRKQKSCVLEESSDIRYN